MEEKNQPRTEHLSLIHICSLFWIFYIRILKSKTICSNQLCNKRRCKQNCIASEDESSFQNACYEHFTYKIFPCICTT